MIPIPPERLEEHLIELSRNYDVAKQNILASEGSEKFKHVLEAYGAGRAFLDMYNLVAKQSSTPLNLRLISDLEQFEAEVEQYKEVVLRPLESSYEILFKSEEKSQKLSAKKSNFLSKFLSGINIFKMR